jgi:hypothetical protein
MNYNRIDINRLKHISNKQCQLLRKFWWIFVDFGELLMHRLPKLIRNLPKGGRFLVVNSYETI